MSTPQIAPPSDNSSMAARLRNLNPQDYADFVKNFNPTSNAEALEFSKNAPAALRALAVEKLRSMQMGLSFSQDVYISMGDARSWSAGREYAVNHLEPLQQKIAFLKAATSTPPDVVTAAAVKAPIVDGKITGIRSLESFGRFAPLLLAAAPVIEGVGGGIHAYQADGGKLDIAEGVLGGVANGLVDTALPGAREGYSDVVGGGKLTPVDRMLNGLSDATGTGLAVGTVAMGLEAAGVVSIPAVVPTALATGVDGLINIGVNATKGILKATGLAGQDQDGGYIYDGIAAGVHEAEKLLGTSAVGENAEALLKQTTQLNAKANGADASLESHQQISRNK